MISNELLDILACPKCKGTLEYESGNDDKNGRLICRNCKLQYDVVDDIPNLIIEDAKSLGESLQS
jgi:uncharacterized protein YbaR (Trm112 family)